MDERHRHLLRLPQLLQSLLLLKLLTTCLARELHSQTDVCREINEYLVHNVTADDLDSNIKAIKQVLSFVGKHNLLNSPGKVRLLEKLSHINEVLTDEEKCKPESYQLLDDVTAECSNLRSSRIYTLIQELEVNHSKKCVEVLTKLEPREFCHLNQVYLERVHKFTDAAIRSIQNNVRFLQHDQVDKSKLIERLVEVPVSAVWALDGSSNDFAADLLNTLISDGNKSAEVTGKSEAPTASSLNIEQLYQDQISQPCKHYMSTLSQVFGLWEKNRRFFEANALKYADFNYHYYRFEICRYLTDGEQAKRLYLMLTEEAPLAKMRIERDKHKQSFHSS